MGMSDCMVSLCHPAGALAGWHNLPRRHAQTITAGALVAHLRNLPPSTPVYMLDADGEQVPCQYAEMREWPNK